jgi:5-(carboxyamino)imidazole ribonucleotide mutase
MLAAKTTCRCSACRCSRKALSGVDSLHSIVQMPKGIPVATFAIGEAGAANAALFAVAMLANEDPALNERCCRPSAQSQTDKVLDMKLPEV